MGFVNSFYYLHILVMVGMSMAWHCYWCNLTFKERPHVDMHDQISKHNVREVEIPE